ncbi:MAG: TIGR03790 family protein [Phycisphaerales bacterium]|nr:MAG: TIGR03790 family protein [Phycisphaerales bacterium]
MSYRKLLATGFVLLFTAQVYALDPNEILVVANSDRPASMRLARYYCQARGLHKGYVVPVSLGAQVRNSMSRDEYEKRLAQPLRRLFRTRMDLAHIKCLVTTYGVPYRVGPREALTDQEERQTKLHELLQKVEEEIARLEANGQTDSAEFTKRRHAKMAIQMDTDRIEGRETHASVDSELSLVLGGTYELYRWQPNLLRSKIPQAIRTLMVCRLDGPTEEIAQGLIDKAIAAEANGLAGTAYFDSRGIFDKDPYGRYDQSIRDLALLTQLRTTLPVKEERTVELFQPGTCREAALYCGWYSVKKYVDAFEFAPGAVGFHIASFEAVSLRDIDSTQWCPALLRKGITATLGAVAEPYLHTFPEPKAFFSELFEGKCLVEAFYQTKPFNSWQLVLIGDPLYRPFGKD